MLSSLINYIYSFFYTSSNYSITICNSPNSHLKNVSFNITPSTIKPGSHVDIKLIGDLDEDVSGGKIVGEIDGFIKKTYNLCEKIDCSKLKKGHVEIDIKETVPNTIIFGKHTANFKLTDQRGEEILCVTVKIKF